MSARDLHAVELVTPIGNMAELERICVTGDTKSGSNQKVLEGDRTDYIRACQKINVEDHEAKFQAELSTDGDLSCTKESYLGDEISSVKSSMKKATESEPKLKVNFWMNDKESEFHPCSQTNIEIVNNRKLQQLFRSQTISEKLKFPFSRLSKRNPTSYHNVVLKPRGSIDSVHNPLASEWINRSDLDFKTLRSKNLIKVWMMSPVITIRNIVFAIRTRPDGSLSLKFVHQMADDASGNRSMTRTTVSLVHFNPVSSVPHTQSSTATGRTLTSSLPRQKSSSGLILVEKTIRQPLPLAFDAVRAAAAAPADEEHDAGRYAAEGDGRRVHPRDRVDELYAHPRLLQRHTRTNSSVLSAPTRRVLLRMQLCGEAAGGLTRDFAGYRFGCCAAPSTQRTHPGLQLHSTSQCTRFGGLLRVLVLETPQSDGRIECAMLLLDYRTRRLTQFKLPRIGMVSAYEIIGNRMLVVGEGYARWNQTEEGMEEAENENEDQDLTNLQRGPTSNTSTRREAKQRVFCQILVYELSYGFDRHGGVKALRLEHQLVFRKSILLTPGRTYSETLCRISVVKYPKDRILIFPRTFGTAFYQYDYQSNQLSSRSLTGAPIMTVLEEALPNDQVIFSDACTRQIWMLCKPTPGIVMRRVSILYY